MSEAGGRRLTRAGLQQALAALAAADADLARAMRVAGAPALRRRPAGFEGLVSLIVEQQISVAAGRSIFARLAARFEALVPEAILAAGEPALRECGLTRQKARYCTALARALSEGRLDLRHVARLDDEQARAALTALPGIGPWTAEVYLMFCLGRPDVWPAGDLALAEGARLLKRLRARPDPQRLERIGRRWRPHRSAAALLLWRYYSHRRAGGEA